MKCCAIMIALLGCACTSGLGPVVPKTRVQRQMIGLLEKFDRWDYNGDGFLDSKELTQSLKALHGKPQQVTYTAADVLDFYDANHDQKITLREAQRGYERAHEAESQLAS